MTNSIPVIMVSVMAEQENGLALDVEDYLVKPIDVERLAALATRPTARFIMVLRTQCSRRGVVST